MNCSSVYIFKNKEDRQNIEMYQKLADLVLKIEGEIYPDNLAISKRADKFYRTYDEAVTFTKKERMGWYESDCQRIEGYLQRLREQDVDISNWESVRESNIGKEEMETLWEPFLMSLAIILDITFKEFFGLHEAFQSYCSTYNDCYFKTTKGDIFMWVSGKYCEMNMDALTEVAETPEEKEIVSKVMIGYSRHCKEGYWFDDMKEPKLPEWNPIRRHREAV